MNSGRSYHHNDIKRYLQQQMSAQEMHEFEKAMHEDPFLADALEGYVNADQNRAGIHLMDIQQKVQGKKDKARVVPFHKNKTTWWQVAVLLLLIVGAGLITYQVFNNSADIGTYEMATATPPAASTPQDSLITQQAPLPTAEATIARTQTGKEQKRIAFAPPPVVQAESVESMKQEEENQTLVAAEDKIQAEANAAREKEKALAMSTMKSTDERSARAAFAPPPAKKLQGIVVDEAGEPVANATVRLSNSPVATLTNAEGAFALTATDTSAPAVVESVGYDVARVQLQVNDKNKILLRQSNEALSEVVVTGISRAKARTKTAVPGAAPQNGWHAFNQYVTHTADSLKKAHNIRSQTVNVLFEVDRKGKPHRITIPGNSDPVVLQSVTYLLMNGPVWKATKRNHKAEVTITF